MSFQTWSSHFLKQIRGVNPFDGDCLPTRVSLIGFGRPTLPFPHLWNYKNPIKIFETFYWDAEKETGSGKHNRYIYVAGLPPVNPGTARQPVWAISANFGLLRPISAPLPPGGTVGESFGLEYAGLPRRSLG